MQHRGKRWIYRVEDRELRVENAWKFSFWAQERVLLENQIVASAGEYGAIERRFELAPDQTGLSHPLNILITSGFLGLVCVVTYGAKTLTPVHVEHGRWWGPNGTWPEEDHEDLAA